jgi:putative ABC transport system permease protein
MTRSASRLLLASLSHYRAVNAAVVLGVAVAVAVLAGALLVGASVRESLREIALGRLGATDLLVSSPTFFRSALADELIADPIATMSFRAIVPIVALDGAVVHEDSRRVATRVQVFGIDERFGALHQVSGMTVDGREALLSPALAAELGSATNDSLILRIAKPTDIPLGSLQGRREEAGERIRLVVKGVLDRDALGEFSLSPSQGPALSLFVPMARLQRDLDLGTRVNALLFASQSATTAPAELLERGRAALATHLVLDDLGLAIRTAPDARTLVLESRAGVVAPAVADRAAEVAAALGSRTEPVLAYLANAIRIGDKEVPYSLVAAVDVATLESASRTDVAQTLPGSPARHPRWGGFRSAGRPGGRPEGLRYIGPASKSATRSTSSPRGFSLGQNPDPIWLNEWAASDLDAKPGDEVILDYYLWSDETGLSTGSATFQMAGVVPMSGAGGDRTLVPDYPGITDASDVTSWDPPFPVDLSRVRPKDEQYWDDWRTAPKAFVPLGRGQALWPSPFGSASSMRIAPPATTDAATFTLRLTSALLNAIDPFASGLALRHVRAEALQASTGTTDFGEYFVYFSFFLLVAGLLLAGMFFAMGAEQRTRELGLLGALGFSPAAARGVLTREALILTALGCLLGAIAAVAYAAVIMYGLRTWWVGAVGTTALRLHVSPLVLIAGSAGAFVAAVAALRFTVRRLLRRSPRDLLTGDVTSPVDASSASRASTRGWIAAGLAAIAIGVAIASTLGIVGQVAGFFACGGLLLIAGLTAYSAWLWRAAISSKVSDPSPGSVIRLGTQYARWRPGRSVLSAALIAFACFVIVAVGAFRRDQAGTSLARESGTGGFALMAESVAPLMYDPNTASGRGDLGLASDAPLFAGTEIARFRLRPGDETSCLTLYRPSNPRIIAPEPAFLDQQRFSFAASLASTPDEHANPWRLLTRRFDDGAVPAIVDQTSLMYVFHLAIGDDFVFTPDGSSSPVRLRIVGALADSVLQSEMIVGEDAFVRLFPRQEGYRLWLIDTPPDRVDPLATMLEDQLADYGVDTIDTRARLAAYHQVENTYLSTFQTLGGLGLLVGTLGLAAVLARNVLERRRELGLMRAVGYTPANLRTLVLAESATLIAGGALLGTLAALVATWPALAERAQPLPIATVATLLALVCATGAIASIGAVRLAASTRVVDAIKSE